MKRTTTLIEGLFILSLVLFSCGHLDGNNPLGVTGGGANGYGSLGSSIGGGTGGQIDQNLFGTWQHVISSTEYEMIAISSGTFQYAHWTDGSIDNSFGGTWYVSGNFLFISFDGETQSGPYSISGGGDTLTFTFNGESNTWHKVS